MNKERLIPAVIIIAVLALGVWFFGPSERRESGLSGSPEANQNNMGELKIEDVVAGTGAEAKAGTVVTVNYTGTFTDGKKFDSSFDHGQPFTFLLGAGQVISGWDEGVAGMKVGGKRKLTVPPQMAYGPNDYGPIPGNSTLLFEVELLDVQSGQ